MFATLSKKLLSRLRVKDYRDAYVAEHVRTGIAYQIRAMREARKWSQKDLATKLNKPQSVVSRLENPDYGRASVQSLLDIASAFDVALLLKFTSFADFAGRYADVSPQMLNAPSYDGNELKAAFNSNLFLPTTDQNFSYFSLYAGVNPINVDIPNQALSLTSTVSVLSQAD